uniref:Uncharacterized protein n=1 Tax=Arundo donax TaxID=35708 RepID=A0A0A9HJQ1_ARUDO
MVNNANYMAYLETNSPAPR